MTLVEVLTQHRPSEGRVEDGELALLETLPEPFLEVARHCLKLDSEARWTVAEIRACLSPEAAGTTLPGEQPRLHLNQGSIAGPPAQPPKLQVVAVGSPRKVKHYAMAAVAAAAILAAMLAVFAVVKGRQPKRNTASTLPGTGQQATPAASGGSAPMPSVAVEPAPAAFVAGKVVKRVLPDVPRQARSTIRGKVEVRVKVAVDVAGKVTAAALEYPGSSDYFAHLAVEAARAWRFTPPKAKGLPVASEWVLAFQFGRNGATVSPTPVMAVHRRL